MRDILNNLKQKARLASIESASSAIKIVASVCLLGTLAMASGCAVTQNSSLANGGNISLEAAQTIALLPISNLTDVPQAGLRAESILEASLRSKGFRQLQLYPPALNAETLFEPSERKAQIEAEKWAAAQKIRYVLSGSVTEWRYKVGVDGEPVVGLVVQMKDLNSGQIVWSSSGARSGWSREALSAVAQKLIIDLLSTLQISAPNATPAAASNASSAAPPTAATPAR